MARYCTVHVYISLYGLTLIEVSYAWIDLYYRLCTNNRFGICMGTLIENQSGTLLCICIFTYIYVYYVKKDIMCIAACPNGTTYISTKLLSVE